MSWLTDVGDWIGSGLGAGNIGSSIGSLFDVGSTVVGSSDSNQKGDGLFGDSNLFGSLISAGTALAGIYFQQTGSKELAEEAAKQRMQELAYAAAHQKETGGGAGARAAIEAAKIQAATAKHVAKMNNLADLYSNWAGMTAKSGADLGDLAIRGGQAIAQPLITRAARL